jgi:hypothetical protein
MRPFVRLLLALPLLFAPLAACGSDGASAAEIVAGAPAATLDGNTALTEMVVETPGLAGGQPMRFTASGAIDFEAQRATMTMDMGELLSEAGLGEIDATVELIQDGTILYLRSALFSQGFGGVPEGHWLGIDMDAMSEMQGFDIGQLQQLGGNDPRQGLAFLTGVSDEVKKVGEEEIRGTDTTRYRAVVDFEKAVAESGAVTDEEQFRRLVEQFDIDELTVDVWIDGDNRVRRMLMPMPLPDEAGGGEMTMTIDYFDFGTDVDVRPPPADQVADFQELMAGLQDAGPPPTSLDAPGAD